MRKIIFILISVMMASGCVGYRLNDPYTRAYPWWPKWKLATNDPDPSGLIDYKSVFVNRYTDEYNDYYEVFRFWPSGQLMIQFHDVLDPTRFNSFHLGIIGYYKIVDQEIWVEVFSNVAMGSYQTVKGNVDESGNVVMTQRGQRRMSPRWALAPYRESRVYERMAADLKELEPDW